MKILGYLLALAGIGFCVAAWMGHFSAWAGGALCLFAAAMVMVAKRKK